MADEENKRDPVWDTLNGPVFDQEDFKREIEEILSTSFPGATLSDEDANSILESIQSPINSMQLLGGAAGGDTTLSDNNTNRRTLTLADKDNTIMEEGEEEEEEDLDPEGDLDIENFPSSIFSLSLKKTKSFKHREEELVNEMSYTAKITPEGQKNYPFLKDLLPQLYGMFYFLVEKVKEKYLDKDLARVFITHETATNTNITVGPDYLENISADVILEKVGNTVHSNNFIPADEGLVINFAVIKNIQGLQFNRTLNVVDSLKRKGCILGIYNQDHLCLPRAIVVALAREKYMQDPTNEELKRKYDTLRRIERKRNAQKETKYSEQKRQAIDLMKKVGLSWDETGHLAHIPLYEEHLQVNINVVAAEMNNKKIYCSPQHFPLTLWLYYSREKNTSWGHFSVITKMNALLGKSYYCDNCDTGFDHKREHSCATWCAICGRSNCSYEGCKVMCDKCHATCRSLSCLKTHRSPQNKGKNPSLCSQMLFCPACHVLLKRCAKQPGRTLENHLCGEVFCRNCEVYYTGRDHKCYMRSQRAEDGEQKRFLFYDFESVELEESGEHVPNLVVVHSICDECNDTLVTPTSKCNSCGSRCADCDRLTPTKNGFEHDPCLTCGFREVIFSGRNTLEEFCEWLFTPQHFNMKVLAHNAKAYDGHFIYSYLTQNAANPDIIFTGNKIMSCTVRKGLNIQLLDSVNYLPMPLAKLPAAFGLSELKKGYFPHKFNTEDNQHVVLPHLPDQTFYDPDNMSPSSRAAFLQWYKENVNQPFDFQQELLDYCRSDVNILLSACWKFRQLVNEVTGDIWGGFPLDVFNYITIASLCMAIFRCKFLPENYTILLKKNANPTCNHQPWQCTCVWLPGRKVFGDAPLEIYSEESWHQINPQLIEQSSFVSSPIAIIPPYGYNRSDNQSAQALTWLKSFESQYNAHRPAEEKISIQTCQSAFGEKTILWVQGKNTIKYKVDGYFVDPTTQEEHCLEYNGCWYHGCRRCFNTKRDKILQGSTFDKKYENTLLKEQRLRDMGFKVHSMWECDFKETWGKNPLEEKTTPLQVRDSYFGGRTNGIHLKKTFREEEKGYYLDFCSLYPDVLKYRKYPVGHPERITCNFAPLIEESCTGDCFFPTCTGHHMKLPYFGLIKLQILPPRGLLFPILPVKCLGKLMFPLCVKCCYEQEQQIDSKCQCSDEERTMHGTWCIEEVNVALNMGYKIVEIEEILHWSQNDKDAGLFQQYINTFLRIKTEASGFPTDISTAEEKQRYIDKYRAREGVNLISTNITKNPGLRSLAKLALNSFYGKFGQRNNMRQTVLTCEPYKVLQIWSDPTLVLKDYFVVNEKTLLIEYENGEAFQQADHKTNVIIASFCTAYARLKLWQVLARLDKRVLYHDTDSVIFSHVSGEYFPPVGEFLGELTNELDCKDVGCRGCSEGHWITDFVSCGPKNYAFKLNTGETSCKVRGFSLNYTAQQTINFTSMVKTLQAWYNQEENEEMNIVKLRFQVSKKEAKIFTIRPPKKYRAVYDKRQVKENFETVPFGY